MGRVGSNRYRGEGMSGKGGGRGVQGEQGEERGKR